MKQKRSILRYIFAVLLAGALIGPLRLQAFADEGVKLVPEVREIPAESFWKQYNGTNWMSGVPDSRPIYELNIPGAHDCGCSKVFNAHLYGGLYEKFAITQELSVPELLNAGVRMLDLRFTNCQRNVTGAKRDSLFMCHGKYQAMNLDGLYYCTNDSELIINFEEVLSYVRAFLAAHPTETVLLDMSCELEDSNSSNGLPTVHETIRKKIKNYPWIYTDSNRIPTLGEVRGKAVLITTDDELKIGLKIPSCNGTGSGSVAGTTFLFQNYFELDPKEKLFWATVFNDKYPVTMPSDPAERTKNGFFVFLSSNCFALAGGYTPKDIAKKVNLNFYQVNHSDYAYHDGRFFGWVYSDFVRTSDDPAGGEHTAYADYVWRENYPAPDKYYSVITYKDEDGRVLGTQRVVRGTTVRLPSVSADDFACWEADDGSAWQEKYTVMKNVTLTAKRGMTWDKFADWLKEQDEYSDITYTLTNDLTAKTDSLPFELPANSTLHLNLNGHTIDAGNATRFSMSVFRILSRGMVLEITGPGKIIGAKATEGKSGAFNLGMRGTLILRNLTLTGCSCKGAGAICAGRTGRVILEDTVITGNTGNVGAVAVYERAELTVSGSTRIEGNTARESGGGDLYLAEGKKVTVGGALTEDAHINIAMQKPDVFTAGFGAHDDGSASPSAFFTSADPSYPVMTAIVQGQREGALSQHIHSFKYAGSGDTITVTCQNEGCTLENGEFTLRILPPAHKVYGDGLKADVQTEGPLSELNYRILYTDEEQPDAPVKPGTYSASLQILDWDSDVQAAASVSYTVEKQPVVVSGITAKERVYDGTTGVELDFSDAKLDGLVEGDSLEVTGEGVLSSGPDWGSDQTVEIRNLSLSAPSELYYLDEESQQKQTTAKIDRRKLTVTAKPQTILYGDKPVSSLDMITYDPGELADGDTISAYPFWTSGDSVGTGAVNPKVEVFDADGKNIQWNYDITYVQGALTIEPRNLTEMKLSDTHLVYNGSQQTVDVLEVKAGDMTVPSEAWTVSGNKGTRTLGDVEGHYRIKVTAKEGSGFRGSLEEDWWILPASASDFAVEISPTEFTYTGQPIEPDTIKVTDKNTGEELENNKHYTLRFLDNTDAGFGKVEVTGQEQEAYYGTQVHVFRIAPAQTVFTAVPEAVEGLEAGEKRELVTAGSADGGTVYYALGADAAAAPEADEDSDAADRKWSTSIPEGSEAGTYYVWYKAAGDQNHTGSDPQCISVKIEKKAPVLSASMPDWACGTTSASPAVEGNAGGGAVSYAYKTRGADDSTYTSEAPTDAGMYTVKVTVKETDIYLGAECTADFEIVKGVPAVEPPTALAPAYSGSEQALVQAGSADGGILQYALSDAEADEAPADGWTETVPSAVNAGVYKVWYKAVGDENHEDTVPECVLAPIDKAAPALTVSLEGWAFGDAPNAPSVTGNNEGGKVTFAYKKKDAKESTYTEAVPAEAGDYTVRAVLEETDNFLAGEAEADFAIGRADASVTAPVPLTAAYNGEYQDIAAGGSAKGGRLQYALGIDGETAPAAGWQSDIPKGKDAGSYYVWFRVNGDKNHKDTAPACVQAEIGKAALTDVTLKLDTALIYTGSEQTVEVSEVKAGALSVPASDYTVSGNRAAAAGTYTVTVTANENGNFTGTCTAGFEILPQDADTFEADLKGTEFTYTGEPFTPSVTVTSDGALLKENEDYTLEYLDNIDAGFGKVKVTGKGNYKGTQVHTFVINKADPSSEDAPQPAVNLVYNGEAQPLVAEESEERTDGEVLYAVTGSEEEEPGEEDWDEEIPKMREAGTWYVWCMVRGDANHNDLICEVPEEVTIAKREITVSGILADDKYYDGNTDVLFIDCTEAQLEGVIEPDLVVVTADGHFEDASVGENKKVFLTDLELAGDEDDLANYTLAENGQQVSTTAAILPNPMNVDASGFSGTYDGAPHGITVKAEEEGVNVTFSRKKDGDYTAENPAFTAAGTYKVYYRAEKEGSVTVSGAETVSIDRAQPELTKAPAAIDRTYDEAEQPLVTGGSVSGGTLRYALGENAAEAPVSGYTETIPSAADADTYYVWYQIIGDENHRDSDPEVVSVKIGKAKITPSVSLEGWTYGEAANAPAVKDNDGGGSVSYTYRESGAGDAAYTSTMPAAAGSYTVRAVIGETDNYEGAEVTADFVIGKAALSVTAPSAQTLTYNGRRQALVGSGSASGGTIYYAVGTSMTQAPDDSLYSTALPMAADAGTYPVWYRAKGDANHTDGEPAAVSAKIGPAALTDVVLERSVLRYNGEAQTVGVAQVKAGTLSVSPDAYTVSGNTQTEAGQYTVTVTAKENGNFTGTCTAEFEILEESAETFEVTLEDTEFPYSGKAVEPEVTVTSEGVMLTKGTDYTLEYLDNTNAGFGKVKVTGAGSYKGTVVHIFTINKASIEPAVSLESWTYGAPNRPVLTGNTGNGSVTWLYKEKDAPDDSFGSAVPTDAGSWTVKAVVAETANYKGAEASADFAILKAEPSVEAPTAKSLTYNGHGQSLAIAGSTADGTILYALSDAMSGEAPADGWQASVPAAVNAGSYRVWYRVTGDRNHTDSAASYMEAAIAKAALTGVTLKLDAALRYTGSEQTVEAAEVKAGALTVPASDYEVSGNSAVDPGMHTVTVSAKDDSNYTGTCTAEFEILPQDADTFTVRLPETEFTYNGTMVRPPVEVLSGEMPLEIGRDYLVTYSDNIDAGFGKVKVTGNGNYKGTVIHVFNILKADASVVTPPAAKTGLVITGEPQELVEAGTAEGGTLLYAVTASGAEAPADGWGTGIPQAAEAGTYSVWYKVAGDENHNDTAQSCVTVTIGDGEDHPDPEDDPSDDKKTEPPAPAPAAPAVSGTFIIGGMKFSVQNGTAAAEGSLKKNAKSILIPDTVMVNGQAVPVTAIAPKAFMGMKKLKSATIGANIETIGAKAFYKCKKLKTIKIRTVKLTKKSVGKKAFGKTHARAKVKVPKKVKKAYKKFLYKKGLKKSAKIK